jgi:hypothetical protein
MEPINQSINQSVRSENTCTITHHSGNGDGGDAAGMKDVPTDTADVTIETVSPHYADRPLQPPGYPQPSHLTSAAKSNLSTQLVHFQLSSGQSTLEFQSQSPSNYHWRGGTGPCEGSVKYDRK